MWLCDTAFVLGKHFKWLIYKDTKFIAKFRNQ